MKDCRTGRTCPVCSGETAEAFRKTGEYRKREYAFRSCISCGFLFVSNPDTDFASIYDEAYYHGLGADPKVDYVGELVDPDSTVRAYEWRGVLERIRHIAGKGTVESGRWLDYGCGNGGLVRYLRKKGVTAFGCDDGWITSKARSLDVPVMSVAEVLDQKKFDIVTAVEVLEHAVDPIAELRRIRSFMNPGAVLFVTTGNLSPWSRDPERWGYVVPEIHVSYFTPDCLTKALSKTGFAVSRTRYGPGWTDIVRFKLLKNLGIKKQGHAESMLPWPIISRMLNAKYRWTDHPVAWAKEGV